MNQKSLDKKKPSELFEGVNSTLHQAFVGAVERDKNKPKELEWEEEFYKNYRNKLVQTLDSTTKIDWIIDVHEFINKLLTQQRTELLEEILNLECLKEEKDREQRGSSIDYNFDVEINNQLRKEIIEEINNLKNNL